MKKIIYFLFIVTLMCSCSKEYRECNKECRALSERETTTVHVTEILGKRTRKPAKASRRYYTKVKLSDGWVEEFRQTGAAGRAGIDVGREIYKTPIYDTKKLADGTYIPELNGFRYKLK